MSKTRTWGAATAGICVLLILAAYFLLIAPKQAEAADLRDQTMAQDQANAQTTVKTQQLKAQYAQLPAKRAELAVIKQQLPDNPALPTLIRSLSAMADASGVTLTSLTPAPPAPFTGTTAPAAAVVAPTAGAVVGAGSTTQLLAIATTVVITGDYASSTLFVQKLQAASGAKNGSAMTRAFLVQSIKITPFAATDPSSVKAAKGQVQTTLTGQVFVLKTAAIPTVSVPSAG